MCDIPPPSKRIRIDCVTKVISHNCKKCLFNVTYLCLIISYLSLKDIIISINPLTNYHSHFLYSFKQKQLLKELFVQIYGNDFLKVEQISKFFNTKNESEYESALMCQKLLNALGNNNKYPYCRNDSLQKCMKMKEK